MNVLKKAFHGNFHYREKPLFEYRKVYNLNLYCLAPAPSPSRSNNLWQEKVKEQLFLSPEHLHVGADQGTCAFLN